jgi:hypothetical protein
MAEGVGEVTDCDTQGTSNNMIKAECHLNKQTSSQQPQRRIPHAAYITNITLQTILHGEACNHRELRPTQRKWQLDTPGS